MGSRFPGEHYAECQKISVCENQRNSLQLFHIQLKVFPIFIPPLRDRKEDIPLLVNHFIQVMNQKTGKHIQGLSRMALRLFMDYHWPGNVRELENAIEHAFVLCNRDQIEPFDLPIEIHQSDYTAVCSDLPPLPVRRQVTRKKPSKRDLLALLAETNWNKAEVARRTGWSRTAIWKFMKKFDIPLQPFGRDNSTL